MYNRNDNRLRLRKPVSLDEAIHGWAEHNMPPSTHKIFELQRAWEAVAPPQVREHADSVVFSKNKETVILVYVANSTWAAELNMQKEFYRIVMEDELGRPVEEVKFLVSRITSQRKKEAQ